MRPTKLYSGTPATNFIKRFEVGDGEQKTLFVVGGGAFAANLVVLANADKDHTSASDADYVDFSEDGLIEFNVSYSVQPVTAKGAYGVKFTAVAGNVEVFCY